MKPLVIPPAAQRDENSIQVLSAWIAEKGLHCSLNIGMWQNNGMDEPRAWGILLADVVRHVANAIEEQKGHRSDATVASIVSSLERELDSSTSAVRGGFHPGHT